ncbi:Kef-type K+ transport system membrane component KefB [Amycolatopsis echigonensis]|uniref:Kef-type K+ transport system membrane component KefB n=1 Tax=Amycolatopsis echigonensis TaxID=2576905 RepID=A0A2N3WJB4_9PSEU|nr:cation:proton antiporter [Amycolatopsis niigatensis]PKV93946.1 Kef-type K+ transport system membrane component KefB [Amycolatopsis niigatensis]
MTSHQTTFLLFELSVIVLLARLLGCAARRLGQPPVIGEVLAGILLGPTLFHGEIANTVFPLDTRPLLTAAADMGVAVFMFLIGLELDHQLTRAVGRMAATVALASILVPFALGIAVAFVVASNHPVGHRTGFILFLGTAMAITAFPVLARILADRGMSRTRLGGLALTAAAIGDLVAWMLLAVVLTVAANGTDQWRILLIVPFLALMRWGVRPLLRRLVADDRLSSALPAVAVAGLLASGALTEWIGLHFIFGAFLFGVVMPRTDAEHVRTKLVSRLSELNTVLFLPVFFVIAGFNVDLSSLSLPGLAELGLILLVAVGGKFGAVFAVARLHGLPARDASVLGTLMNTRGLTELIILGVGLSYGMLDQRLYILMVAMAVLTTMMTGPLISVIGRERTSQPTLSR